MFVGAMLANSAIVFASEGAGVGPVLVAPLQGSESLRVSHAAEVEESLVRALSSRGLAVAEADAVLGHALVACQSRACVEKALTAAGAEASVVLYKVADSEGNFGYNAATDQYGDMVEMGILDPTKVARSALQNAASIAGLMITTEAMVAEAPQDDKSPAMPEGMGNMDY